MNHTIAMHRLLQRTCLVTKRSAERKTYLLARRCCHNRDAQRDAVGTSEADTSEGGKRLYSKFTAGKYLPSASLATAPPMDEEKAFDLIVALSDSDRAAIKTALQKFEANKMKKDFEARLALTQWRTRFGRPSKVEPLSNVDPTGQFCTFPEDWLRKRAEFNVNPPKSSDLYKLFFVNAVPFIGFGFLDNFLMIVSGETFEDVLGSYMCISTMAAAGLGNTVSDIVGIGSANTVEQMCVVMGLKPPDLSQVQLQMKQCRRAANMGRVIGITIGCLLGMLPLLFIDTKKDKKKKEEPKKED